MIAATVLAAGDSVRMGSPKALLTFRGLTFLEAIAQTLGDAGLVRGYVVIGRDRFKVLQGKRLREFGVVHNDEMDMGPIGSIRSVIRAVPNDVDALMVWPVDIPHVKLATVVALSAAVTQRPIVAPVWRGKRGHPMLLKREIFSEILQLSGGSTARDVVRADADRVHRIEVDDPAILESIDTPEDYARLLKRGSTRNNVERSTP